MKKVKYFTVSLIAISLFVVGSFSSCKKYLNVDPSSTSYNKPEELFSTVGGTYGAIIGTYQNLTGDQGYGIRLNLYYGVDNDEMIGPTSTPYPDNTRRDLAHYALSTSNSELQKPFAQLYQGVEQANLCIYYIQKSKLFLAGNTEMRRMLAEAYTLRAQFYFDLVKIWGDVPFYDKPHVSELNIPVYPTRMDRDSIYQHLLDDLHFVDTANLIGWMTKSRNERITLDAVKGLRARIALFRAGYSLRYTGQMQQGSNPNVYYKIAAQECLDIINHYGGVSSQGLLNPSFQTVFQNNCNHILDKEILFAVGAVESGTTNGTTNTKLGYYNGPKLYQTLPPPTPTTTASLSYGNQSLTIIPSYFYRFDSSDVRRDVTICIYNPMVNGSDTIVGTPSSKLSDGKFRRDWLNASFTTSAEYFGIDFPLLRYSDVLLMFSEAVNELRSDFSLMDAVYAFNQVRLRANVLPLASIPSQSDFRELIIRERSLELGCEGVRKYDLIRWNQLGTRLKLARLQVDSFANTHKLYCNGVITTIPTSVYWSRNNDGSIYWWSGNAGFYQKQINQPAGTFKASWSSGSAGISDYTSNGATVSPVIFTYTGINYQSGKSELYPIPIQEVQINPNLKYIGNKLAYPSGNNPGY